MTIRSTTAAARLLCAPALVLAATGAQADIMDCTSGTCTTRIDHVTLSFAPTASGIAGGFTTTDYDAAYDNAYVHNEPSPIIQINPGEVWPDISYPGDDFMVRGHGGADGGATTEGVFFQWGSGVVATAGQSWVSKLVLPDISFEADPGYRVTGITVSIFGVFKTTAGEGVGSATIDYPYDTLTPVGIGNTPTWYSFIAQKTLQGATHTGDMDFTQRVSLPAGASGETEAFIGSISILATISPVPEPATWALVGLGLTGVAAVARRRAAR